MNNITFREATINDAKFISSIHVLSWKKTYKKTLPASMLDNLCMKNKEEFWVNKIKNKSNIYVVTKDGIVQGFCSLSFVQPKRMCILNSIYVSPKIERNGFGSVMMKNIIIYSKAAKINKIELGVLESNTNAILFYRYFGFQKNDTSKYININKIKIKESAMFLLI
ncbi:GNAT family N-acetyltransferase [Aliivibrio fischeri]|uniref:GNAT family N-acetyltransferase n=1 Tax=Aliivibrio fischeri TaxID=668 RepID=UPI00084C01EE|nr:GNAT family N-acetyltransferase [Aliivibrio fischeri]OED53351.1 hypothetical protein BEI47_05565 [Aliivibrio fischeri]